MTKFEHATDQAQASFCAYMHRVLQSRRVDRLVRIFCFRGIEMGIIDTEKLKARLAAQKENKYAKWIDEMNQWLDTHPNDKNKRAVIVEAVCRLREGKGLTDQQARAWEVVTQLQTLKYMGERARKIGPTSRPDKFVGTK